MTILLQQSTFWRCAAKYYRFFRFLQLSSCVMSPLTDDELLFFLHFYVYVQSEI